MNIKPNCYDYPRYYELAFAFRDLAHEVDVIQQTIQQFARVDTHTVLTLACGPSPHLLELSARGLQFVGLDINPAMLAYSKAKAQQAGIAAKFYQQSMTAFQLEQPVDYILIALGDLYVQSNEELDSHLSSVAAALRPGGLFLLDWCIQFEPANMFKSEAEMWEVKQGDLHLKCQVRMQPFDHPNQLFEEQLAIEVQEGEQCLSLASHSVKRAIYPQEFLQLIKMMQQFEFIGWWNNWTLDEPLTRQTQTIFRPITLLRKR
ncbi:Methyltransferase domain-containing protein [Thiothrix eikelboomii]|uniref:Methyltransferase domain-containing protein n=1 Tax=Thiothrix eikelboomii TaxID=92487 RepID=A0A1T4XSD7_9GAMM|nr:class I SAM-dependent methyltransferase [Thiothrix eikelboomii]SKA92283.1 Methyltransferase domain-containing protein [Thiothrix eikelboomii]